jgi:ubiquinone/menaquinone biosynthesis C-methylase UbiE
MGDISFEQVAYELEEIWQKDWFDKENKLRIKRIASMIDSDTESLLDVGCGNGMFLDEILELKKNNYFKNLAKICGVDRSFTALKNVSKQVDVIQSSIDKMNYEDGSFECVTCLEVIEHLPIEIYKKAINELYRISSKKIILAVPYKEDIENSLVSCKSCSTKFNPDFHMRAFDEKTMASIFGDKNISLKKILFIGKTTNYLSFGRKLLSFNKKFPSYAICPLCGFQEHYKLKEKNNYESKPSIAKTLAKLIKRILPKKPTWIVAVYEK